MEIENSGVFGFLEMFGVCLELQRGQVVLIENWKKETVKWKKKGMELTKCQYEETMISEQIKIYKEIIEGNR